MQAQPSGEDVFKANCAACHMLDRRLVGPQIIGSFEKIKAGTGLGDEDARAWLENWISNSMAMVTAGDEYAVKVFEEFNKIPMNSFETLSEEELDVLVEYIVNDGKSTEEPKEETAGDLEEQLVASADATNGRELFNANCKTCHLLDREMTGPALDGAFDKIKKGTGLSDEEATKWMAKWIRNSQSLISEGDPYANQIFNKWNKTPMNTFLSFSDDDLLNIIDYIRNWDDVSKYPAEVNAAGKTVAGDETGGKSLLSPNLLLLIIIVVLLVIALILSRLTNVLGRMAKDKAGEEIPKEVPFYLNKNFITVILILVIAFFGFKLVDGAINLGRQQGYAPEQPIHFSHKLHAGINQIDCKYCHYGAEKGKSANIPSPSICMNCHKFVNQGPDEAFKEANGLQGPGNDPAEIAKIYAAVGFNPETQSYDPSKAKAIEWVRIHNLPDHVYFNHAQHVAVGQIECQTCHGPIEEMDVVEQFSQLSMGWCIQCHRKTEIQFTQNSYYDNYYDQLHKKLKNGEIDKVTVEMIGGTDCQKCHY
jgi:mono/diheme cytochrome c family protein